MKPTYLCPQGVASARMDVGNENRSVQRSLAILILPPAEDKPFTMWKPQLSGYRGSGRRKEGRRTYFISPWKFPV